jgi:hypothetical protein
LPGWSSDGLNQVAIKNKETFPVTITVKYFFLGKCDSLKQRYCWVLYKLSINQSRESRNTFYTNFRRLLKEKTEKVEEKKKEKGKKKEDG